MTKTYLLTGGTGFLGSYLAGKILKDGDAIIFLGRSKKGISLENRFKGVFPDNYLPQVKFLEADYVNEEVSLLASKIAALTGKLDGIWHLAADLSFKEEDRERIVHTNTVGAKNVAALALHFTSPLYYVSTAYVHGRRSGTAFEQHESRPKKFNNPYEESKFDAEAIIKDFQGIQSVILRPSILIDAQVTRITNFGYYSFLISLNKLRKSLNLKENTKLFIPLPLLYSKKSFLNLMPVDIAIDWMYRISKSPQSIGKIFHICNPKPFNVGSIFQQTFVALKLGMPTLGVPKTVALIYFSLFSAFGAIISPLKPVARRIKYFKWYMLEHVSYDMTNMRKVVGNDLDKLFDFPHNYIYTLAIAVVAKLKEKTK